MAADLFEQQRRDAADASERAARARARIALRESAAAGPPPQTFDLQGENGCGNCGHWRQRPGSAVLGDCSRRRWMTSFAAKCPDHTERTL